MFMLTWMKKSTSETLYTHQLALASVLIMIDVPGNNNDCLGADSSWSDRGQGSCANQPVDAWH